MPPEDPLLEPLPDPPLEDPVAIETSPAPTSIVEVSLLDTRTLPAEMLELLVISASVVPVIVFVTMEPPFADVDSPTPPADTAIILAAELASTWSAPGVVTVELSMYASVVSVIVFVIPADPSADPPVAIETWPEPTLMVEVSVLDTVILGDEIFWLVVI